MPVTKCPHCFGDYHWSWEDAFLKFGFGDGEAAVMTHAVAEILRKAGYAVNVVPWGLDEPRDYLPKKIIRLLDRGLSNKAEVDA